MDVVEVLGVLWRRKVVVALSALGVIGASLVVLALQANVYQATATIGFSPRDPEKDIVYILNPNQIMPLYAEAVKAKSTQEIARSHVPELAHIRVRTFADTPILKIDARSGDRFVARRSAQAMVDALISRTVRADVGIGALVLTEVDRPQLPSRPVSPRRRLTIAVGVALGLGFGAGAGLLRESLARHIDTTEQLADAAGIQVFCEIAHDRCVPGWRTPSQLVNDRQFGVLAEAFRDLRTNLLFAQGKLGSVLVTSPEGRHGKTTVSLGLAVILARSGARTLLVDGDLRRGRVASQLGLDQSPGLMDLLAGSRPEGQVITTTELENLSVLAGGAYTEDLEEMFEARFPAVLGRLEGLYDVVVVDSTPLVPVNDARITAKSTSCTLLVVTAGTGRAQVTTAVERLSMIGRQFDAGVFNNSKATKGPDYYAYLTPESGPDG